MKGEPIHPWRWRLLALWIFMFTVIVFVGIRVDRRNVTKLKQDSVTIAQLRQTDCALWNFLLTARDTRLKAAAKEPTSALREQDQRAAYGYNQLAQKFTALHCGRVP